MRRRHSVSSNELSPTRPNNAGKISRRRVIERRFDAPRAGALGRSPEPDPPSVVRQARARLRAAMGGSVRAGAERSDRPDPASLLALNGQIGHAVRFPWRRRTTTSPTRRLKPLRSASFVTMATSPGPIVIDAEVYVWCIGHALAQKEHHAGGWVAATPVRRGASLRLGCRSTGAV